MQKLKSEATRARFGLSTLATAVTIAIGSLAAAQAVAAPTAVRTFVQPNVQDLGVASPSAVKTFTVGLAMRNAAALDPLIASISDPSSPNFRQFMTPAQFAAQFGQSDATVAQVVAYLQSYGFNVLTVHANNLMITVSATNAQIGAAFGTTIHAYTQGGLAYEAPSTPAVIPAPLTSVVSGVAGLSNKATVKSRRAVIPTAGALAGDVPAALAPLSAAPSNQPGSYTVRDLAAIYNINPLYAKGYTGAGKTIGIATLAGYNQSDAYAYWQAVGLTVPANRIVDVQVDGGALPTDGPGTDGAGETSLDVEQSGGVATGANMRVYIAPNTDSGFVDVFATAINENLVDVLSVSWGSAEVFYDPGTLSQYHVIFQQAAAQGIPVIAASGDAGAYDVNRALPYPDCSLLLSVDFPAADNYVLAAGGTTLPNTVQHKYGPVTVTTERAWGWDYLKPYITTYYTQALYNASYLPVGGGGGVSSNYIVPSFQTGLTGVAKTAKAQTLFCGPTVTGSGYQDLVDLPPNVAGRNLPDVSLNADPYSGYLIVQDGGVSAAGGTSFVAPQLNGILTLINQGIQPTAGNPKGRIGYTAPLLYGAFKAQGYAAGSPFKAITAGTNDFYPATASYNPATGLGSLDVNALANTLGAVAPSP